MATTVRGERSGEARLEIAAWSLCLGLEQYE